MKERFKFNTVGLFTRDNKAQGTKFFRDDQLLIEKNGKIYNAQGAEVK